MESLSSAPPAFQSSSELPTSVMEEWLLYIASIVFSCLAVSFLLFSLRPAPAMAKSALPPGPSALSAIGPLVFLVWTSIGIEPIIRAARRWYGPVFTLPLLPSSPVIFVADRAVARRVLVQSGAAFADRPPANLATQIFSSNQHNITSGAYGPVWRALRRNLTSKVLHPSCLRRYSDARRGAAAGLVAGIARQMRDSDDGAVVVEGLLHHAIFHVFVAMCFGEGLGNDVVASVTALQREFLTSVVGFQVFSACPAVTKLVFRRRWNHMLSIRRRQEELFIPLIRARRERRERRDAAAAYEDCYADSLLGLVIPEDGGRNLTEIEMVSLCSELLAGGTDSTVAVWQWTMANLVTRQEIQAKLRAEIHHVVGASGDIDIRDEHLPRMPYLRAIVLEGLRRHLPGRFMLPHAATEDGGAELDGFSVPRHALVNFTLGGMAMDGAVWREPREFRPERFLPGGEGEDVDLTGSKEIKMMPFGAGRRICPGIDAALLHLQWFVAHMVREFEWSEVPGEPVDFAEKQEMSVVMRRPLRAKVVPCMH